MLRGTHFLLKENGTALGVGQYRFLFPLTGHDFRKEVLFFCEKLFAPKAQRNPKNFTRAYEHSKHPGVPAPGR